MVDDVQKYFAETIVRLLGDKWKVLIIQDLLDGTKRFGELKKSLGDITQKVLTSNLRMLEEKGLLVRQVYAQIPPRVEYTLTAVGYSLKPVIEAMLAWGAEYRENMLLGIENFS
ncbi:MAG: helix-turn-helix transcriptional regulator [Alphaproteobacteria bacterium]|nr:helix-turn-helix transcriptional regulator [Alphaproteobacteria bacterium]MBQ7285097.1 helix-turn-helix transcriptional regulator [Alphaproteobacteria bacterium]